MAANIDNRTLYVANLHKNVTEEILYELFLQAGPVERVSIPNTGTKNFSYGFVTYFHQCSVDYAIQLYKGTSLFKTELLIRRKGDRSSDQQTVISERYISETENNGEIVDEQVNSGQSYSLLTQQQNYNSTAPKKNMYNTELIQNSLKGHWSKRSQPYNRNARRHYSSRSHETRDRHRNRLHCKSDYNKSYRGRKGRY